MPALLATDSPGRAQVRALAQSIACEIHPISEAETAQARPGRISWARLLKRFLATT